jgi:hypothetical protein
MKKTRSKKSRDTVPLKGHVTVPVGTPTEESKVARTFGQGRVSNPLVLLKNF